MPCTRKSASELKHSGLGYHNSQKQRLERVLAEVVPALEHGKPPTPDGLDAETRTSFESSFEQPGTTIVQTSFRAEFWSRNPF
jgi:hypothetical protein